MTGVQRHKGIYFYHPLVAFDDIISKGHDYPVFFMGTGGDFIAGGDNRHPRGSEVAADVQFTLSGTSI